MRYGNNDKLVQLIAIWMILVMYPWFQYFFQRGFIPQTLLEGIAILGIVWVVFCALGLVMGKEVARLWSIWMFAVYFLWSFYIVCFNILPFFSSSVGWLSQTYYVPAETLKGMMLMLLITHIMWPLIVVMYLTNPSVKVMFHPIFETDS